MMTLFVAAELDLPESIADLHFQIETELRKQGEPLRWAITAIDRQQRKVQLEAVITVGAALAE